MSAGRSEAAGTSVKRSGRVFAALGDETRLYLVFTLSTGGPMSITRLKAGTRVSRQAVTKHLRVLEEAGIARSVKLGRESVWRLEPAELEEARRSLEEISTRWDQALNRLKAFVEKQRDEPASDA